MGSLFEEDQEVLILPWAAYTVYYGKMSDSTWSTNSSGLSDHVVASLG